MNLMQFKTTNLKINGSSSVNEDFIANVRFQFKVSYFNYRKAKAKWKNLFNTVDAIVQKPVEYNSEQLSKNKSRHSVGSNQSISEIDIALKPLENSTKL